MAKKSFFISNKSLKTTLLSPTICLLISILFLSFNHPSPAQAKVSLTSNIVILAQNEDEDFDFDFEFEDSVSNTIEVYDPLEKVNRKIFAFNEIVDKYFFEHIARGYRKATPRVVRKSIGNFFTNLSLPFTSINSALQGDVENALSSFSHFLINSTIGIGGLFDVASTKEIKYRDEDFGQTFAKYGMGQGPYLVLPLLGPSSIRDGLGMTTRRLIDPLSINMFEFGGSRELIDSEILVSLAIIEAIDKREGLIEIISDARKDSFDLYATARSAYIQRRSFKINNQN
ncbi:MAG: VacJ family lipoprotein [Proteobacteria bacterium]|nr:VacJ family lipoprotein [Pseudomonadota bacterium]